MGPESRSFFHALRGPESRPEEKKGEKAREPQTMPGAKKDRLTPKQERYCQERMKGKSQRQSYRAAYDAERMTPKTIDESACRLEADSKVAARLHELRARSADQSIMTRDDIAKSLTDIATSSCSESARLKALDQLARLQGAYDDHTQVDIRAAVLTASDKSDAIRAYLDSLTGSV